MNAKALHTGTHTRSNYRTDKGDLVPSLTLFATDADREAFQSFQEAEFGASLAEKRATFRVFHFPDMRRDADDIGVSALKRAHNAFVFVRNTSAA
jgi:hypothetical protein